jgi:hypothetical protein
LHQALNRPKFVQVRKALEASPLYRVSKREYLDLCRGHGLTEEEAEGFLAHLSAATVVAKFEQAPNFVFLKPDLLSSGFLHLLDASATGQQQAIEAGAKRLQEIEQEIAPLQAKKDQLDVQAGRQATRTIWGVAGLMVAQLGVVARLTWWELSWDIMEPITYLLTYSTSILCIFYFGLTKRDYTYEGFWERTAHKKRLRLYRRHDFRPEQLDALRLEAAQVRAQLEELGAPYRLPPHAEPAKLRPPSS